MTVTDTALPRRTVLDQAWRAAGLADTVLSGRDGAPLARTVKCLLDPLVVRPRLHPDLARPVLDDDAAERLTALIVGHADLLRATDGWYGHLKRARRERGIRNGNPQELYFPRAWELAHAWGPAEDHHDPAAAAAEVIEEIHPPDDLDPAEITEHLRAPAVRAEIEARLTRGWATDSSASALSRVADRIAVLLSGDESGPAGPETVSAMTDLGRALQHRPGVLGELARTLDVPEVALSRHAPVRPPPVLPEEGIDPLPLDRSIRTRVLTAVKRAPGSADTAAEVVAIEVDRATAPWGLSDAELYEVLLVGVAVAGQLRPLAERSVARGLAATIEARLRKEAYVLRSRRMLAGSEAIHPAQQAVVAVLAEFWRPYLSRLWVRLHGLDVTGSYDGDTDRDSWRDLVTGIARSVSLDQRTRIRTALERAS